MFELQIFVQRRRKMLARLTALTLIGLAGMAAVLPRTDARVTTFVVHDPQHLLLSPEPVSGQGFSTFYELMHR